MYFPLHYFGKNKKSQGEKKSIVDLHLKKYSMFV